MSVSDPIYGVYFQKLAQAEKLSKEAETKEQAAQKAEDIAAKQKSEQKTSDTIKTAASTTVNQSNASSKIATDVFSAAQQARVEAQKAQAQAQQAKTDASQAKVVADKKAAELAAKTTDIAVDEVELTTKTEKTEEPKKTAAADETKVAADETLEEWEKEQNAGRPDAEKHFKELRKKGMSKKEAAQHLYAHEAQYAKEDAEFLQKKFEENPQLREHYRKNFDKLPPRLQKAMLAEMENRIRNGEKPSDAEVLELAAGIKNSKDATVKAFALAMLDKYDTVSKDKKKEFFNYIGASRKDLKASRARNQSEAALVTCALSSSDKPETGTTAVVYNKNQDKNCQEMGAEIITDSNSFKKNDEVRNAYSESISELDKSVQVYAHKLGLESKHMTESNINILNAQIKKMFEANQKQAFSNADNSDKLTENNRKFLASEIKYLAEKNQIYAIQHMIKNERNLNSKDVMASITNEIPQLKVNLNEQQKLFNEIKATGKVDSAVINKAENNALINAMSRQTGNSSENSAQAKSALIEKIYNLTGSKELAYGIATGKLTKNNVTLTKFADLLDQEILPINIVIAAGFKKSLMNNFTSFSRDVQEKVFAALSDAEIMEMKAKGLLPARYDDKVKARFADNMTTQIARHEARSASFAELLNYAQNAEDSTHQNILQAALRSRFADRMNEKNSSIFGRRIS